MPIVPASNLHFVEAPVPYIMGFRFNAAGGGDSSNKELLMRHAAGGQKCFVDVDAGTVHTPEGLPDFPDRNRLIKEISELVAYFQTKRKKSQSVSGSKRNGLGERHDQSICFVCCF